MESTQGARFRSDRWSEYWCLPFNPSKCKATFFSVDPHQANLQPNLLLLGSRLRFNPTSTFLRVTLDRTLSFSKHVSWLNAKFFPRLKALRSISAFSWGPSLFCINLFFGPFSHMPHSDVFFKRYQYQQIGTSLPSGQSRHQRLPLVPPIPLLLCVICSLLTCFLVDFSSLFEFYKLPPNITISILINKVCVYLQTAYDFTMFYLTKHILKSINSKL